MRIDKIKFIALLNLHDAMITSLKLLAAVKGEQNKNDGQAFETNGNPSAFPHTTTPMPLGVLKINATWVSGTYSIDPACLTARCSGKM